MAKWDLFFNSSLLKPPNKLSMEAGRTSHHRPSYLHDKQLQHIQQPFRIIGRQNIGFYLVFHVLIILFEPGEKNAQPNSYYALYLVALVNASSLFGEAKWLQLPCFDHFL